MADDAKLNGSAINEVARLAEEALEVQQIVLEDGRILADKGLTTIYDPDEASWPNPLVVHSLTGLVDYLEQNPDELVLSRVLVVIENHATVTVAGVVDGPQRKRERFKYLVAQATPPILEFDRYVPLEEMLIQLRTRFQPTEELENLVRLLGNVTAEALETATDDGFTQKVSTRAGVALSNEELERIPNPVELRPIRTFPEVEEQPASPFTVRVRMAEGGVKVALFEADGGSWAQVARDEINAFISSVLDNAGDVKILA